MASIITYPKFKAFDTDGTPLAGGKIHTYKVGTTTNKATYTTRTGDVENANPVVLDSNGEADIYGNGAYKLVIKDSDDVTLATIASTIGIGDTVYTSLSADYAGDLNTAITSIGATETTLVVDTDATLTDDATVPATLHLQFTRDGSIATSTYTLTINSPITAGPWQIFDTSGGGSVAFGAGCAPYLLAEWWGENTTPGTTDMTAEINAALTALPSVGGIVKLLNTTYLTTSTLTFQTAETILEGSGWSTKIDFNGASGYAVTMGTAAGIDKLQLRDLWVDCGGLGGSGVLVRGANNVGTMIHRCRIDNGAAQIVWSESGEGAFDGSIRDCELGVYSGQVGVDVVYNSGSLVIDSNWIRGFNGFTDTTSVGVRLKGVSDSLKIINNNIEGIATNILLDDSEGNSRGIVVSGNYCETYGAAGLDVDIAAGIKSAFITENYFVDSEGGVGGNAAANSIRIQDGAADIHIHTNHFINHTGASINNASTGSADIVIGPNVEKDSGAIIDSLTGVVVQLTVGSGGTAQYVYKNAIRGMETTNGPTGTIQLGAAASTVVNNNKVTADSIIFLFPANVHAGELMGGASAPYISAKSAGTSFTIATADGGAAVGDETFNYLIIN